MRTAGEPTIELNERSRGWLRHIWEKATTPDDWSSEGEPHQWWDRESTAPMCAFPRFDLSETSYALPLMADATPAWREVYTEIAAGLVERSTTFWGAIDWITLIGADPNADAYPPEWMPYLPEHLRGRYDPPGWTGNGKQPWGLQPDPIGSDGNLFYRGFFNLILGVYAAVSGDDRYREPFEVTGYMDRRFEWTHQDIAGLISSQLGARPEGPHCENTKIWPFCVSGAGLGLRLYDTLHGDSLNKTYDGWIEFAQQHYMGIDRRGELEWFAAYYDPIEKAACSFEQPVSAYMALITTPYVYPQRPDVGQRFYELAVRQLGWDKMGHEVVHLLDDPRLVSIGLLMAHELGDTTTETRLRDYAEEHFEPRFFGEESERFGWFFGFDESWPRGQQSALLMVPELGPAGAWFDAFNRHDRRRFSAPTIRGVDYPTLGISRAYNDTDAGELIVSTYAATPSRAGRETAVKVSGIPGLSALRVLLDGTEHASWRACGEDEIEIELTVGETELRILTGYRGGAQQPASTGGDSRTAVVGSNSRGLARPSAAAVAAIAGCSCC